MSAPVPEVAMTLCTGERAAVVSWDGTTLVFRSPRAFAPGAPVKSVLVLAEGAVDLELKAVGSRRADGETLFVVRGRAMNLRRELRLRLDAALRTG